MEFDDFPILTNDEYDKMKNEYLFSKIENHDKLMEEIFDELLDCKSICVGLDKNINKTIRIAIESTKNEIDELCSDLSFSYKIEKRSLNEVKNFDIFLLLKKLIEVIDLIQKNKPSMHNSNTLLSAIQTKIISITRRIIESLCSCNIFIFKHF